MLDDISSIVQIDDPDIDTSEIYARIRDGLRQREPIPEPEIPAFERPQAPQVHSGLFSDGLVKRLQYLNDTFDKIWVELSLIEEQFPVIGTWVNRFKQDLHRLVIYYVNDLAQKQQATNADVVRVLDQIVYELDEADLPSLRRDLDEIRHRLTTLEQRAAPRSDGHSSGHEED